jgi:hypothetical protein
MLRNPAQGFYTRSQDIVLVSPPFLKIKNVFQWRPFSQIQSQTTKIVQNCIIYNNLLVHKLFIAPCGLQSFCGPREGAVDSLRRRRPNYAQHVSPASSIKDNTQIDLQPTIKNSLSAVSMMVQGFWIR